MSIYGSVSSKTQKARKMYVGVANAAKQVSKIYVGVGGTAHLCWSAQLDKPTVTVDTGNGKLLISDWDKSATKYVVKRETTSGWQTVFTGDTSIWGDTISVNLQSTIPISDTARLCVVLTADDLEDSPQSEVVSYAGKVLNGTRYFVYSPDHPGEMSMSSINFTISDSNFKYTSFNILPTGIQYDYTWVLTGNGWADEKYRIVNFNKCTVTPNFYNWVMNNSVDM